MSSISSRPRVEKIAGSVLTTVAAAGVVLAAKAIESLLGTVTSAAKLATAERPRQTEQGFLPVAALSVQLEGHRRKTFERMRQTLPAVEALRAANLETLMVTPFYLENAARLEPHCRALQQATTLAGVRQAGKALQGALESGHHQIFVDTLSLACQRAAARVGFDRLEVVRLPDQVRIIAEDAAGRALVTEIQSALHRAPALATEVVGVSDPSCQQILDDFDRVLEEEGVHSAPAQRKFTGGVCELAGARKIASRKLKPLAGNIQRAKPEPPAARTRQFNRRPESMVRSKD